MELLSNLSAHLFLASVFVTILCCIAGLVLKFVRFSPSTQVVLWMLALLPGCILVTYTIELPWLDTDPSSAVSAIYSTNIFDESTPLNSIDTDVAVQSEPQLSVSDLIALLVPLIWTSGFCFLTVRHIKDLRTMNSLIQGLAKSTNGTWLDELESVSRQSCFAKTPTLLESANLGPIACFHNWHPAIVVPVTFWNQCDSDGRLAILQHELAHHQRRDCLTCLLGRLLCLLQWFNPAAWIALRKIEDAIELACDDLVVDRLKARSNDYAKTLVSLVEFQHLATASGPMAIAAASPPIQKRIERIVHPKGFEMSISRKATMFLFAAIVLCAVLRIELVAQQNKTVKPMAPPISEVAQRSIELPSQAAPAEPGTTALGTADRLTTQTYDVGNILFLNRTTNLAGPTNRVGGVTLKDFEQIAEIVKSTVQPEFWKDDLYTIQPYPPNLSLIISCSKSCHEEVAELLEKLRELRNVTIRLQGRIFVVPKDHVLSSTGDVTQGQGIEDLVEAYGRFQKDAVASAELPARTLFSGEQVAIELPPNNKCGLLPLQFHSTVDTVDTDLKIINCAVLGRKQTDASPLANGTTDENGTATKPTVDESPVRQFAPTWMSQRFIKHEGIQVFDISNSLETNRDIHRAFLVAYATIHVRDEAK